MISDWHSAYWGMNLSFLSFFLSSLFLTSFQISIKLFIHLSPLSKGNHMKQLPNFPPIKGDMHIQDLNAILSTLPQYSLFLDRASLRILCPAKTTTIQIWVHDINARIASFPMKVMVRGAGGNLVCAEQISTRNTNEKCHCKVQGFVIITFLPVWVYGGVSRIFMKFTRTGIGRACCSRILKQFFGLSTEGKTFYSWRLFITDNWKESKDLPVPSRDLYIKELTAHQLCGRNSSRAPSDTQLRIYRALAPTCYLNVGEVRKKLFRGGMLWDTGA